MGGPLYRGNPYPNEDWPTVQESTRCRVCLASTQGRKPYCLKHLYRQPYVAHIRDVISQSNVPTRLMV